MRSLIVATAIIFTLITPASCRGFHQHGGRSWHAGHPLPPHRRASLPLPRPRLDWELLHPEAYARLSPDEGLALALELFGGCGTLCPRTILVSR